MNGGQIAMTSSQMIAVLQGRKCEQPILLPANMRHWLDLIETSDTENGPVFTAALQDAHLQFWLDQTLPSIIYFRWRRCNSKQFDPGEIPIRYIYSTIKRLQDTVPTETTAAKYGFPDKKILEVYGESITDFVDYWDSYHRGATWESNPWVCVIKFATDAKEALVRASTVSFDGLNHQKI